MAARDLDQDLIGRLLDQPQGFDLFQAISLLERDGMADGHSAIGESDGSGAREAVRLSSHVSLGFEASDVKGVRRGAATGEAFTLSTPVLSLLGQAGPLPSAFTELVIERNAAKDFATADFLDILHHRLLSLFYLSRKRRRLGLGHASPQASTVARATDQLCGLNLAARPKHAPWLRHAGLLGGAPRSMTALCAMLSDRYAMPFRGEQFIGGWQRLEDDELTALGKGHRAPELGRSAFLGRRVWDQAAAIRLTADGQPMARVLQLLPGGETHDDFKAAVRGFIPSALRVEVSLTPTPDTLVTGGLSSTMAPRLGWNAWMGDGISDNAGADRNTPLPARFSFECTGHEH
ncbi:MAG: hypothetical protein RL404_2888 [Pseudomonadota bacterium]